MKVKGVRRDVLGIWKILWNGSRGFRIGDGIFFNFVVFIVEGFISNGEIKVKRGLFISLDCEFIGCLLKEFCVLV